MQIVFLCVVHICRKQGKAFAFSGKIYLPGYPSPDRQKSWSSKAASKEISPRNHVDFKLSLRSIHFLERSRKIVTSVYLFRKKKKMRRKMVAAGPCRLWWGGKSPKLLTTIALWSCAPSV